MRSKRSEFGFRFHVSWVDSDAFGAALLPCSLGDDEAEGGEEKPFFFAGVPFAFVRPLAGARRVAEDAIVAECGTIVIC